MDFLLNQAVFSTKFVVEMRSPIVCVTHDHDGAWQFFGAEENVVSEHARIVTLDEILKMDPSIRYSTLQEGQEAYRDKIGNSWIIK